MRKLRAAKVQKTPSDDVRPPGKPSCRRFFRRTPTTTITMIILQSNLLIYCRDARGGGESAALTDYIAIISTAFSASPRLTTKASPVLHAKA